MYEKNIIEIYVKRSVNLKRGVVWYSMGRVKCEKIWWCDAYFFFLCIYNYMQYKYSIKVRLLTFKKLVAVKPWKVNAVPLSDDHEHKINK
jgi:hypothetical protein